MGNLNLSKFSSQASPDVLNGLHQIADAEGRKFHAVLDEAFRDYLNKKGFSINSRIAMMATKELRLLSWILFYD